MKNYPVILMVVAVLVSPAVHAQMAVVDVAAIVQLINQLRTLEQQLTQARDTFESMTGGRGMEHLLAGAVRNYLPADWAQLADAMHGLEGAYGALAADLHAAVEGNAILTAPQLERLSAGQRREVDAARQSAAMLQSLARQSLAATSERFAALQSLVDAIGGADDQKAILDLQARIQAEHDMLLNDGTKIQVLFQSLQAEEWARRQREREQGIAGMGSLRELPPLGLPAIE